MRRDIPAAGTSDEPSGRGVDEAIPISPGAHAPARAQTDDPSETEALGARLAKLLRPGDVVLVAGDLGAGKTTLIRGAAKALGVTVPVTSPTFTIGQRYPAPVPVSHIDLYRVEELGGEEPELLEDYLGPHTITFVEWPLGAGVRACGRPEDRLSGAHAARGGYPAAGGDQLVTAILGFDTATRATTVAFQRGAGGTALEARDDPLPGERPRHTGCLLPLAEDMLARASASWGELERIAVGVGPGTFTGLRIGISTARALAQVLAIPVVAVPTLEALALAVLREGVDGVREAVVAVLDARRGEVFAAAWSLADSRLTPLFEVAALAPRELAQRLTTTEGLTPACTLAVGDGAIAFRSALEPSGVAIPGDESACHRVSAVSHCRLGFSMPARPPGDIHPCYVRAPDAVPRTLAPTP